MKFPFFSLGLVLLVFCLQAGKKPVRAVLWVSADGLRVVDDKTKVMSPFSPVMSSDQNQEQPQAVIKVEARAVNDSKADKLQLW